MLIDRLHDWYVAGTDKVGLYEFYLFYVTASKDALVVSVADFCFETAKSEGYYAFPDMSPRRATDKIAFHRVSRISSITHIADVTEVVEVGKIDETYCVVAFGDKEDRDAAVFH